MTNNNQAAEREATPPANWDEYALKEAQRLWALPEMPKSQLVSVIQCALIDAMRFAQPASSEEPVGEIVAEDMGRPFNAAAIRCHFYTAVPPIGTKLYTRQAAQGDVALRSEIEHLAASIENRPVLMDHGPTIAAELRALLGGELGMSKVITHDCTNHF